MTDIAPPFVAVGGIRGRKDSMKLFGNMTTPELIEEARDSLARAKEAANPKLTLAMFSGGNDSTTMLRIVKDQIDAAVHIRTGIGIDSTFDHVRNTCDLWGLRLIVLETQPDTYRKLVLRGRYKGRDGTWKVGKGFPGPALHYICYHHLKQKRLRTLQKDHAAKGEKLLLVGGIRKGESKRRARRYKKPQLVEQDKDARRCWFTRPIVAFSSEDMATLRQDLDVPQCEAAALIHKSGECLCGAFAKPGELKELEYWFPKSGKLIRDLEREAQAAGKEYCKWGHGAIQGESKPVGPLCQGCELFKDSVTAPAGAP